MPALGKTGLDIGRQLRRVEGGARHHLDADLAIGAGDQKYAVIKSDIGLGRLEQVRGDAAALGDQLLRGGVDRGAANRQRREPPVPRPKPTAAVSPCNTRILSRGMPSFSAASWA